MADIINELKPDKVIIDCPHPVPEKFKAELRNYLVNKEVEIVAEHRADYKHSIVGAASIMAKVTRDAMIKGLEERFGVVIGSGYPSDPNTVKFVNEFVNGEHSGLGEFVRHSWSTIKSRLRDESQRKLA